MKKSARILKRGMTVLLICGLVLLSTAALAMAEEQNPVVLIDHLEMSNVVCTFTEGENPYNEGSVGTLTFSADVTGPADVAEIRIAAWRNVKPTAEEAKASVENMTSVWQESESTLESHSFPFTWRGSRPVMAEDLGKTQYLILAALDTNVNAVGYAVIEAEVPGTEDDDPEWATLEIPDSVMIPSLEECEAYTGWEQVSTDDYQSIFVLPRQSGLPYKVTVQFIQNQGPGVVLEYDVTGTDADPAPNMEGDILYNAIQVYYPDGNYSPRNIWITTSVRNVGNLFDDVFFSLYYDSNPDYKSISSGMINFGINSQRAQIDVRNGNTNPELKEDVIALFETDGLQEERLAWLNSYRVKSLEVKRTGVLSIYDYINPSKTLYLPENLKEIESQAFVGIDAEEAVIPGGVQKIAEDAFDDDICLILQDSLLEDWAKEYHPNYRIEQQ